jgi:hypothetical protein
LGIPSVAQRFEAVVDLVRLVVFAAALVNSARARLAAGVCVGATAVALLLLETYAALRWPRMNGSAFAGLSAVFLGPSSLANAAPYPGAAFLSDPLHHVIAAGAGAVAAHLAFARSRRLPAMSPVTHRIDRAGVSLVGLAVLEAILTVIGALHHVLDRDAIAGVAYPLVPRTCALLVHS